MACLKLRKVRKTSLHRPIELPIFSMKKKVNASHSVRPSKSSRGDSADCTRLAELLNEQARGEGFFNSAIDGVRYMRSTLHLPRNPVTYQPSIVIIAQGEKIGHFGHRTFVYDSDHYLVLTLPLPFECETRGSPREPVLGLSIALSPPLIAELLMQMEMGAVRVERQPRAIEAATLEPDLRAIVIRLAEALRSRDDAKILGPALIREITYRVLLGKLGGNLRALAAPQSHFGQISRVLNRLHADYAQAIEMETLAREAGMSVSTFHAHFKAITASSPLQYLKTVRLHKAQLLMVNEGAQAAEAALAVGYESASQFSREFKRHFGVSPAARTDRLRAQLISLS